MKFTTKTALIDEDNQVVACEGDFIRVRYNGLEAEGYLLHMGRDAITIGKEPELSIRTSDIITLYLDHIADIEVVDKEEKSSMTVDDSPKYLIELYNIATSMYRALCVFDTEEKAKKWIYDHLNMYEYNGTATYRIREITYIY